LKELKFNCKILYIAEWNWKITCMLTEMMSERERQIDYIMVVEARDEFEFNCWSHISVQVEWHIRDSEYNQWHITDRKWGTHPLYILLYCIESTHMHQKSPRLLKQGMSVALSVETRDVYK
jgi:hypothetical protein